MATITIEFSTPNLPIRLMKFYLEVPDAEASEILNRHNITLTGTPKADSSSLPDKTPQAPPSDPKPAGDQGKGAAGPQTDSSQAQENDQPPATFQGPQGAPKEPAGQANPKTPTNPPAKLDGPICPTHGSIMRKSTKPGKNGTYWFCPRKTGSGPKDYCKERM